MVILRMAVRLLLVKSNRPIFTSAGLADFDSCDCNHYDTPPRGLDRYITTPASGLADHGRKEQSSKRGAVDAGGQPPLSSPVCGPVAWPTR